MATEKRLIDPDDFLKWVINRFKCVPLVGSCDNDSESMKLLLTQAPTVDAVEVIHGEWRTKILCGGFAEEWGYVCSVCGCTVSDRSKLSFGKFATGNQKLNYCPNCSADMRERKDNGKI